MPLPWLLIANPPGPRVDHFQRALIAEGQPPAEVLPFLELLRDPSRLQQRPNEPCLVRLDLAGFSSERVPRELLARGYAAARALDVDCITPAALRALPPAHGRIICPRQKHLGFLDALAQLEAAFVAHDRWIVLNPIDDVRALFDKRVTSRRYAALGIAVPEPLDCDGVHDGEALVALMDARDLDAVFVKLSCGSTGECMAIVSVGRRGPELTTTIEQTRDGWYNTRKPRRIRDPQRFNAILRWLLREGSQVERAVDKARLDGEWFDLRVVVVDGQIALRVIRRNRLPITNLHLGGQRGDVAAFERTIGAEARAAADASCRRVFAAHRSLQLGIDVLFERDSHTPMIIEANAFGDNLVREGLGVYRAQIAAATRPHASDIVLT